MKRLNATAVVMAATITLLGAYAQAEDFSQASVANKFLAGAKTCPGSVCATQAQADALNAQFQKALTQCTTAWALDEPAKGPRCSAAVKAAGYPFKGPSTGAPAPTGPVTKPNLCKDVKCPDGQVCRNGKCGPKAVATNPCKPNPCGEGNQCKPVKKDGQLVASCYCLGESNQFGETCSDKCPVCPPPVITTNCVDCHGLWFDIKCHWIFWLIVLILVLGIIGGLTYGLIRYKRKYEAEAKFVVTKISRWRDALGIANDRLRQNQLEEVPEPASAPPPAAAPPVQPQK